MGKLMGYRVRAAWPLASQLVPLVFWEAMKTCARGRDSCGWVDLYTCARAADRCLYPPAYTPVHPQSTAHLWTQHRCDDTQPVLPT